MKLNLEDNAITAAVKLAEGNPGAAAVMGQLIQKHDQIDPDMPGGAFIKMCYLDDWQIYGPHIWILYKDVCEQSIARFIALLRAVQLCIIRQEDLVHASRERGIQPTFNPVDVHNDVCKQLDKFVRPE